MYNDDDDEDVSLNISIIYMLFKQKYILPVIVVEREKYIYMNKEMKIEFCALH